MYEYDYDNYDNFKKAKAKANPTAPKNHSEKILHAICQTERKTVLLRALQSVNI